MTKSKVTLASVIQGVLRDTGEPFNGGKIYTATQARIDSMPKEMRPDAVLTHQRVSAQVFDWRKKHGRPTATVVASAAQKTAPVAPPTPDTYTGQQIAAAGAYLRCNGNSLHRSIELLNILAHNTLETT